MYSLVSSLIQLPWRKRCQQLTTNCLKKTKPLIVEVAQVIGLIISNFLGAEYDPLHYRVFEHDKTNALATNAGNFNTPMRLSAVSLKELQWWITYMYKPISYPVLSMIIHSHTSKKKWHSVFSNGNKIGGRWSSSEALKHNYQHTRITALCYVWLEIFCWTKKRYSHIQLQLDNTTAVAFLYQQNGRISFLRTRRNSSGFVGLVYWMWNLDLSCSYLRNLWCGCRWPVS